MITEEAFEGYRIEHTNVWKPFKKNRDPNPLLGVTPEKQQAVLEVALTRLHTYRKGYSYSVQPWHRCCWAQALLLQTQ